MKNEPAYNETLKRKDCGIIIPRQYYFIQLQHQ